MSAPISLRTELGEAAYQVAKLKGETTPLAEEIALREWVNWKLIVNRFPPTMAFKTAHMLIPKRIFSDWVYMNEDESDELWLIVKELEPAYDQLTINMPNNRSQKAHFHIHLNKFYDKREEMRL